MIFPKFEMFTENDEAYYFRLMTTSNDIILISEGYDDDEKCETGIESVQENALDENCYERLAVEGEYFFILRSANGKVLGISETYYSVEAREKVIEAVKRLAPVADIVDLT